MTAEHVDCHRCLYDAGGDFYEWGARGCVAPAMIRDGCAYYIGGIRAETQVIVNIEDLEADI